MCSSFLAHWIIIKKHLIYAKLQVTFYLLKTWCEDCCCLSWIRTLNSGVVFDKATHMSCWTSNRFRFYVFLLASVLPRPFDSISVSIQVGLIDIISLINMRFLWQKRFTSNHNFLLLMSYQIVRQACRTIVCTQQDCELAAGLITAVISKYWWA
jgi:hypothetical protein